MMIDKLSSQAIALLKDLITLPSISGDERKTADVLENFLKSSGVKAKRKFNNIYAFNHNYDQVKPTLLLNSHHDTVKVNTGWSYEPYQATIEDNKLIGLGSNDAGASLVSLIAAFIYFNDRDDLSHNLVLTATAEEENSGPRGIRSILPHIGKIDFAIVGEPTGMQMAIAEKGLIVLRCQAEGRAGHAARDNGENAILNAIKDIEWFSTFKFPEESPTLGPVKMTVTMINAGMQHNVIPDRCEFTVDIRTTDVYTNKKILEIIREHTECKIDSPSLDLNPSGISENHLLLQIAKEIGIKTFGSPTMSDQAFISAPSVKIGPGNSQRSHQADEYVYLSEIEDGIKIYIDLLERILKR